MCGDGCVEYLSDGSIVHVQEVGSIYVTSAVFMIRAKNHDKLREQTIVCAPGEFATVRAALETSAKKDGNYAVWTN